MTDANGNTTQYVFAAMGRQVEAIYPDPDSGSSSSDIGTGSTTSSVAYDISIETVQGTPAPGIPAP
jgi:hypothetical protein